MPKMAILGGFFDRFSENSASALPLVIFSLQKPAIFRRSKKCNTNNNSLRELLFVLHFLPQKRNTNNYFRRK